MKIDILTLFPKMFDAVLGESMLKRAQESGRVKISVHNLRDWTHDRHRTADDKPFGGGAGMVMKPEPMFEAVGELLKTNSPSPYPSPRKAGRGNFTIPSPLPRGAGSRKAEKGERSAKPPRKGNFMIPSPPKGERVRVRGVRIILLTPQGKRLDQKLAKRLSKYNHLILICGHYEGVDERVRLYLATDEISIGDYILTCGALPAMVLLDSIVRIVPGVLGHKDSAKFESFEDNLLEYPQYTRPADYKGLKAPAVLLSGNHKKIEAWRGKEALKRTKKRRPDLIPSPRRGEGCEASP